MRTQTRITIVLEISYGYVWRKLVCTAIRFERTRETESHSGVKALAMAQEACKPPSMGLRLRIFSYFQLEDNQESTLGSIDAIV